MLAETVQVTMASVSPAMAVAPVGALGAETPGGVAILLCAENGLLPLSLLANTSKAYETPLINPGITIEVGG